MQDASHAEMRRQIRREGRRWGLVPVLRDGRVCVGQKARCFMQRGDDPGFTRDRVYYVADVTMSHGFIGVLMNQKRLEERDAANERADIREQKIQAEAQRQYEEKAHTYDADAERFIRRMGWEAFLEAITGPDPRRKG